MRHRRFRNGRPTAVYRQIGERIREARLRRGMSQVDLSVAIDVGRSTISNYERGTHSIGLDDLLRVARELNVPPIELLPTSFLHYGGAEA